MFTIKNAKIILLLLTVLWSMACTVQNKETSYSNNFDQVNNRIWIGQDFWAVPMEDWQVENGRIECIADRGNSRVNVLTQVLSGEGDLNIEVKVGKLQNQKQFGSVGFTLGLQDETDNDVRSLCYFGTGIKVGIDLKGELYIGNETAIVPSEFDFNEIQLSVQAKRNDSENWIKLIATDKKGLTAELVSEKEIPLKGIFTLANNHPGKTKGKQKSNFWFDELTVSGSMLEQKPENSFGPMLWSMYTLSRQEMKLTVQFPPISPDDEQNVQFQLKDGNNWQTKARAKMDANARTATFSINNWDDTKSQDYRLIYTEKRKDNTTANHYREGSIQRDPVDKPLEMGAMTCQYHYGFPYRPLVEQLNDKNPDILFFSGDQIYEPNGGYGIIRFPADRAILSYLGKWYMFGWAFGDLMKNRPTICLADDHEVFQGNLWGNGGKKVRPEVWNKSRDATSGFLEPVEMVNVVIRTNTSHQPQAFDPSPIEQGMNVYYTDILYGRVSFALVTDRTFKSGPEEVVKATKGNYWNGRKDMLYSKYPMSSNEKEKSLKLLGDRQLKFLRHWATNWDGADMKVLLSQTIFANNVTHYGPKKVVLGSDLDSGGWPKFGRDKAVDILRKCFAFQICGDQHLPSLVQYGIEDYKDAGWVFCTPAIAVGYQRRFMPDTLNIKYTGRPEHNFPNTGLYTDGIGNKNFVYAVGNPDDITNHNNRYQKAQNCASGFGYVAFNQKERTITSNSYRFLSKENDEKKRGEFEGWPKTIQQTDNFYSESFYSLPTLKIEGAKNVVVEVVNNKDLVHIIRINGSSYQPKVKIAGTYNIRVVETESQKEKTLTLSTKDNSKENISVKF